MRAFRVSYNSRGDEPVSVTVIAETIDEALAKFRAERPKVREDRIFEVQRREAVII